MRSKKTIARIAGLCYLVVVLTGIFNLAYVPSKLIVWDDPSETIERIQASETLFRMGIFSAILCYTAFLILPFILYKLLSEINQPIALAMVILAVVSVPLSLVNLNNKLAVLSLLENVSSLQPFETRQLQERVMFYLNQYGNGIQLVSIFWGLWLFPFGYLIFKSRFLPTILGLLLMAGCFGYLINFIGNFFFKGYSEAGISGFIALPASIGEIGTCLYLLIIGTKHKRHPDILNESL